jgi:hypothetical protein
VALSPFAQINYSYSDDFSTNKAMTDSFSHSGFVDSLSDYYLSGFLMYIGRGNYRNLGSFEGFDPDNNAFINYAFPSEKELGNITNAHISLALMSDETGYFLLYIKAD